MLKPPKTITRKELKRDPLMEALYKLRQKWLAERTRIIRYGGGGAALLVVVVLFTLDPPLWRVGQDEKASGAVGISFIEYSRGNYNTVIAQLSPYVEEYRGLKSFANGLFLLARSELHVGDSTRAETHFRLYLDEYGSDPLGKSGALAGLGVIVEGRGDYLEASDLFERAMRSAPTASLQWQYALHAGRDLLLADLPAEALEILEPLLEEDNMGFQKRYEVLSLVSTARALLTGGRDA